MNYPDEYNEVPAFKDLTFWLEERYMQSKNCKTLRYAHRGIYLSTQMKRQGMWWLVNIRYKDIKVRKSLLHRKRVQVGQLSGEAERQVADRL